MKQPTLIIIGVLAAVIGSVVGLRTINNKGDSSAKFPLEALASSLNAKLPMQIDKNTRWDSTTALPPNTLAYHYSILGVDESKIDKSALKEYLLPIVTATYRTSPDMADLRAMKVNLRYIYRSQSGVHLFAIDVLFSDISS